ncbi:MAG: CHASE2 domain-containing protein [Microcoleaceae cyanobacterium]
MATQGFGVDQLQTGSDRFFGICRYGDANQPGVAASPEISSEQQGFSNFVVDPDGIIRRNLLSIGLATDCQTRYSFAWKLAERYLKDEGISTEITPEGLLSLNSTTFHRLEQESLMYESATDFQGLYRMCYANVSVYTKRQICNHS